MTKMSSHYTYIVILAGGEGIRFAPLSTPQKPKQFLNIIDENRSLLQQTFDRIDGLCSLENIFVSTNERYVDLVYDHLPSINPHHIIGEPLKKNTAPAIALMCYLIFKRDPQAVCLFLPADHFIADQDKAREIFKKALEMAFYQKVLVVFGVPPAFASTDYGYVKIKSDGDDLSVECFVEKPDQKKAEEYLNSGQYLWNSGIFVWKAKVLLDQMRQYLPQVDQSLNQIQYDVDNQMVKKSLVQFFTDAPTISIDYGVMEKAQNVVAFPFHVGWSDVGTWTGLKNLQKEYDLNLPDQVKKFTRP